jgi:hypothetical protein
MQLLYGIGQPRLGMMPWRCCVSSSNTSVLIISSE